MNLYFSAYPKVKLWLEKLSQRVEEEKLCRSLSGRRYKPKLDAPDKRKALRRYAQIFAIQSLIADLVKRCLSALHEKLANTSAKLIGVFQHGFIIECEVDDVEKINVLVRDLMEKKAVEYLSGVPINVKLSVSHFWEL
jgi:DNA polymerase I-like protein with 3'-5' exonuclease and polymerase domains